MPLNVQNMPPPSSTSFPHNTQHQDVHQQHANHPSQSSSSSSSINFQNQHVGQPSPTTSVLNPLVHGRRCIEPTQSSTMPPHQFNSTTTSTCTPSTIRSNPSMMHVMQDYGVSKSDLVNCFRLFGAASSSTSESVSIGGQDSYMPSGDGQSVSGMNN